jgi:hypothetical protein
LVGWYSTNSGGNTKPIGLKAPNELGLYDMTGNVWEWCTENEGAKAYYSGGSWYNDLEYARLSYTAFDTPSSRYSDYGFRLARNIGPKILISGTMPEATLNQAYAGYTFTASGVTGAQVWSVSSGSLPPGMSFNATTATLSGTPTTAGNYTFTIQVASGGYSDEVEVILKVAQPPTPTNYAEMVIVQGGTLPVGSTFSGQEAAPFHIGRFETTWGEWKTVRTWATANGYDIGTVGEGSADNHPVRNVNWYDSVKWLNAKSEMEGLTPVYSVNGTTYQVGQSIPAQSNSANGYRLPSEKEWEWAARGGVSSQGYTYSGSNISSSVAWDNTNSSGGTNAVGTKAANELGIYDMSGNVHEWNWDAWGQSWRRTRGGSWDLSRVYSTVTYQLVSTPDTADAALGFRYARNAIGDMVTVQGGTLPAVSGLAGQAVQPFDIGRFEVTWAEWQTVRAYAIANGYDLTGIGNGTASTHPVQNVNWYDVLKWCNAKSQMEGLTPVYTVNGTVFKTGQNVPNQTTISNGYRLPIEIEWEWAARGGVSSKGYTYSGSNSSTSVAWLLDNSGGGTNPIGMKLPNEIGLYDMTGNVEEWCWDVNGTGRRIRGGNWNAQPLNSTLSARVNNLAPSNRFDKYGFRLARNQQLVLSVSATGSSQSRLGDAFNYGLNTTGGVGPYTYQIVSGSLPQGLQLTSDGRITGTSQAAGAFTITMRVTDSLGNTKLIQITITIDPASSNPSIALGAGIDSGGGLTSIGQLNNWSSIGSPMDTTSTTAGSARITPGLLRMLLQLQTQ